MERLENLEKITAAFDVHPIAAILGPRQCGKTTLANMFADQSGHLQINRFDLENPADLARLDNPVLALENLQGLVMIDEIQRAPGLFEVLRVLVDRKPPPCQFLILGSASRDLIRQSSESLAGRIGYIELTPFTLGEVGIKQQRKSWIRGGFPRSFLAKSDKTSVQWRKDFMTTFLERDIPSLGISIPSHTLRRFWMMVAHYHGQLLNYSELGRSFATSDTAIRRYMDILSGTFMLRQLPPWFENIKKRQVKSPKIYIRDSGLFHTLLGINSFDALNCHPKLGPSWEGFVLEEIIRIFNAEPGECYFWSRYGRAELDLLIIKGGKRYGFEVKYTGTPKVTNSLLTAQKDLNLDALSLVYPGKTSFPLREDIQAIGLPDILALN